MEHLFGGTPGGVLSFILWVLWWFRKMFPKLINDDWKGDEELLWWLKTGSFEQWNQLSQSIYVAGYLWYQAIYVTTLGKLMVSFTFLEAKISVKIFALKNTSWDIYELNDRIRVPIIKINVVYRRAPHDIFFKKLLYHLKTTLQRRTTTK